MKRPRLLFASLALAAGAVVMPPNTAAGQQAEIADQISFWDSHLQDALEQDSPCSLRGESSIDFEARTYVGIILSCASADRLFIYDLAAEPVLRLQVSDAVIDFEWDEPAHRLINPWQDANQDGQLELIVGKGNHHTFFKTLYQILPDMPDMPDEGVVDLAEWCHLPGWQRAITRVSDLDGDAVPEIAALDVRWDLYDRDMSYVGVPERIYHWEGCNLSEVTRDFMQGESGLQALRDAQGWLDAGYKITTVGKPLPVLTLGLAQCEMEGTLDDCFPLFWRISAAEHFEDADTADRMQTWRRAFREQYEAGLALTPPS